MSDLRTGAVEGAAASNRPHLAQPILGAMFETRTEILRASVPTLWLLILWYAFPVHSMGGLGRSPLGIALKPWKNRNGQQVTSLSARHQAEVFPAINSLIAFCCSCHYYCVFILPRKKQRHQEFTLSKVIPPVRSRTRSSPVENSCV